MTTWFLIIWAAGAAPQTPPTLTSMPSKRICEVVAEAVRQRGNDALCAGGYTPDEKQ